MNSTAKSFYTQIIQHPEQVIEQFDLVYVNDKQLDIKRVNVNNKYVYNLKGKPITNAKDLERIKNLVIPPAWQNVRVTSLRNGHLQAIGRDKKARKQYKYHTKWSKIRNQTKFYKMVLFGNHLPKIRKKIDQDIKQKQWTKTKVLALIIHLLEETHIRIGNAYYAKKNETYGLTTLRSKHVDVFKDKIKFEFVGKRGKEHKVTIRNKKLIKLVNKIEEIPGWELFKYYDEFGNKQTVDSSLVNEYLHTISGELFTAKDFRTWSASLICFENLKEYGVVKDEKTININIVSAITEASKALGNTKNVCRKYYIHPIITESYKNCNLDTNFKEAISIKSRNKHLTHSEAGLLSLLSKFKPQFS